MIVADDFINFIRLITLQGLQLLVELLYQPLTLADICSVIDSVFKITYRNLKHIRLHKLSTFSKPRCNNVINDFL